MIRKLAMSPSLFGEVMTRFPEGLPSDANLRAKLQTEWKFASVAAADTFIKALREALRIRDSGVAGVDRAAEDTGESIKETPMPTPQDQAIKSAMTPRPGPMTSQVMYPTQTRTWDLGHGVVMTATLPIKLTRKNLERLKRYVHALETEAAIGWDDGEEGGDLADAEG